MKLLQDNIVFLIVFFSTLIAVTASAVKLGSLWIKENSAGKTAIQEIKDTMLKDRESFNKVLTSLQENVQFMIGKLIDKTKH
jgi:hypothetical protein